MKSSLLILAALLVMAGTQPAAALSPDHDSTYANSGGGSRFSDPDDALGGDDGNSSPFGTMQFGNSGSVTFGISGNDGGGSNPTATPPGYYGIYDPTRPR